MSTFLPMSDLIVEGSESAFSVHLSNFDGPFDLLLQLISRHKMDITEIALGVVTDDFIAYIKALEGSEQGLGSGSDDRIPSGCCNALRPKSSPIITEW